MRKKDVQGECLCVSEGGLISSSLKTKTTTMGRIEMRGDEIETGFRMSQLRGNKQNTSLWPDKLKQNASLIQFNLSVIGGNS